MAMTTAEILDIPFRRSSPVSLAAAIKQYISTKYDQHPDMFASDLAAIDKFRTDAINVQEPHISGVQKLGRYAAQLQFISGKFPIDIGANFSWYPAIGYNTSKPIVQNNLQFERANILYNLAALYSQLAGQSPRTTAQGQKAACNYYCAAAGVLKYLKEEVIPQLRSTPPEDMDSFTLECLEQLMLAQAQECFWSKAVDDQNKDSVVARLAASVSDYYDAAAEFGAKSSSIRSEWVHHMCAKQHHFAAAAQYRASLDCLARGKYGEEVARLKDGLEAANTAIRVEGRYINRTILADLHGLRDKLAETLKGAEKDNDLIYLSPVPAPSALPKLPRANMATSRVPKEISDAPAMLSDTAPYGPPLFTKLVPFAVHVAASIYADRRDRLIRTSIIDELELLTTRIHDTLSSLNLPGSLQALERPLGLPPSIVAHNEELRQIGGINKLDAAANDIATLKSSAVAKYNEAVELLRQEAAEDARLRAKHGTDRWPRPPSSIAAGKLTQQVAEYKNILESADQSDAVVREKLNDNKLTISLLAGGLQDLKERIPNSSQAVLTPAMDRTVGNLRNVLNELARLETERRCTAEDIALKAKQDDITSAILAEAARLEREKPGGKIEPADFEPLFEARLADTYGEDKQLVAQEARKQEALLERVKKANKDFIATRNVDSGLAERERAIQEFENAYLKYKELVGNFEVGRKFYNDLGTLLGRFSDAVGGFVEGRRQEAGKFEVDIMNAMHNLRVAETPQQIQQAQEQMQHPVQQPVQQPYVPKPGIWRGDATTPLRFGGGPPPPAR